MNMVLGGTDPALYALLALTLICLGGVIGGFVWTAPGLVVRAEVDDAGIRGETLLRRRFDIGWANVDWARLVKDHQTGEHDVAFTFKDHASPRKYTMRFEQESHPAAVAFAVRRLRHSAAERHGF